MTTPNTTPSDLDREALKKAYEAYDKAFPESGFITYEGLRAGIRAYLSALPRASGVPEAERRPDAYQQLKDGKWVECSEFVARGWGDKLDEGTRALYASPPPVASPSGEAIKEAIDDFEQAVYDLGWQEREGPGMSRHNEVKREYNKARAALSALLEAPPSPIASEPKDAGSGAKPKTTYLVAEGKRVIADGFKSEADAKLYADALNAGIFPTPTAKDKP